MAAAQRGCGSSDAKRIARPATDTLPEQVNPTKAATHQGNRNGFSQLQPLTDALSGKCLFLLTEFTNYADF
jgi:hypothetical protein